MKKDIKKDLIEQQIKNRQRIFESFLKGEIDIEAYARQMSAITIEEY